MPAVAIGVGAAISGAASIYGAHKAASAAKHASDTEAAAADKALEFSKQVYNTREQQLSPYRDTGNAALGTYRGLLGLAAPEAPKQPQGAIDPNHIYSGQSFPASWVTGGPLSGIGQTAPGAGTPVPPSTANGRSVPQAVAAPMVVIEAPDGSRRSVPASLQTFAVARGGKVVG